MIFYFSGVGNSRWVAEQIAEALDDQLVFIPDAILEEKSYTLQPDERLGFIFPTYGWGVPTFVEQFIARLRIENVGYLYMVTTCGDDTGMTYEIFCQDVQRRGWTCASAWAVQMPESYICLPGFDVDTPTKEARKCQNARQRVADIIEALKTRQVGILDTLPGPLKWAKSRIIRPFFNRYLSHPAISRRQMPASVVANAPRSVPTTTSKCRVSRGKRHKSDQNGVATVSSASVVTTPVPNTPSIGAK
jgi:flavodoxin